MPIEVKNTPFIFHTTHETAKLLNVNPITVMRWIKAGRLKARKLTSGYMISSRAIFNMISSRN